MRLELCSNFFRLYGRSVYVYLCPFFNDFVRILFHKTLDFLPLFHRQQFYSTNFLKSDNKHAIVIYQLHF